MKEPYSFTFYTASWYRKSPYWQRTVEAGCTSWDLYNHMLIPTLYDDDEDESDESDHEENGVSARAKATGPGEKVILDRPSSLRMVWTIAKREIGAASRRSMRAPLVQSRWAGSARSGSSRAST